MQKITTFLWFHDRADDAARLYTSLFPDSRVTDTARLPDGGTSTVTFELAGQRYIALNGGPSVTFGEAVSLYVDCADQAEVDRLWSALTADGGRESRCGWLTDRFGLSWQIIPSVLPRLLADPDRARADRAMQAMLSMTKIDIRELVDAADG